jgi:RimJ/RimL family protein N-acetyltransferase
VDPASIASPGPFTGPFNSRFTGRFTGLFTGPAPVLTDGVVTLRAFRDDETDAIVEYSSDPEISRWAGLPQPYTRADADAWGRLGAMGWTTGERYQFAIETEGRLVGDVNLRPQGAGLALVGFGLAATHRRRGLMTRALRLALAWGFGEAGIDVVHWRAQVGNWASRRVAWATGFRVVGVVPGLLEHSGARVDGWLATLRRGDRMEPAHPWFHPEPVTGTAFLLRAHREQDLPRMIEACRDPQTQHWLSGMPSDYSELDARAHLHQIGSDQASGKAVYWVVADPENDRLLAEVAIFLRDPRDPEAEVGYWTHPNARSRGAATEGVRLAVRHALLPAEEGGLGLPRVLLRAAEGNLASLRVAQKAGFTRTGRDRDANPMRDGSRVDQIRFDLLADELPAVR